MNYFDSDVFKSTNKVVYFDGKDDNLYLCLLTMSHKINAANLEQTHQHVLYFYDGKVSLIDGASITIILCLHVLIAHHIFINLGYVDYFQ